MISSKQAFLATSSKQRTPRRAILPWHLDGSRRERAIGSLVVVCVCVCGVLRSITVDAQAVT